MQDLKFGDSSSSSPEADQNEAMYNKVLAELQAEFPGHLPLLQEHLKKARG